MKRFLTLFGIMALILAYGCQEDKPEEVTPGEQKLTLSSHNVAFDAVGGSVELTITATSAWSATVVGEWCTLSVYEGEGDATVSVTAAANEGELRSAEISFTMGEKCEKVTVTQLAADKGPFGALQSLYEVPAEGAHIQIPIPAETLEGLEWNYDYSHEWLWIRAGESEDMSFCGVEIEVLSNNDPVTRECVVTLTKGSDVKDVTIRQAAGEVYLEATPELVEVDFTEQEITLSVGGNVEFDTTYSDGCDWIAFKNENYLGRHFTVSENPMSTPREGQIIFQNTTYNVRVEVTVRQEGRPERPASPPNNQVWYSTWGYGETPYVDDSSFDQKIVSNVYYWEEKLGIITFEGDVTEVKPEGWDYDDRCTKIILPESVTKIGDKGFYKCSRVETFIAPGITEIGTESFAECEKLTSFDWAKLADIPYKAFYKAGFVDLVIPGQIKDITGSYAFRECKNLKTVVFEEGVESISGSYVFNKSTAVESVKFPSTMKSIEEGAFYANYALASIEWGSLESIGSHAFSACMALEELEVPATVKYVGGGAFHECEGLKKLVLAAETIDHNAFSYCISLTDIEIEPTTTNWIGTGVFTDCDALEHFTFPDHFTSTGVETFHYCDKLSTIDFANIETIQHGCFAWCPSLTEINIPGTVKTIESNVFLACKNITSITLNEGTEEIYESLAHNKTTTLTIPASVKVMGGVFADESSDTIYFKGDCPEFAEGEEYPWCRDTAATVYCPAAYYENFSAKRETYLGYYVTLVAY